MKELESGLQGDLLIEKPETFQKPEKADRISGIQQGDISNRHSTLSVGHCQLL